MSPFSGPRALLLVGLLAWASACAVEDRVAYIIESDAGSGPLSIGDGGPSSEWALPDCAQVEPDAGTPCAAAETAEE
ncbi:hypothetical protein K8638_06670 [Myxococcus sp. RHST-1-4]|nr:hypothetical protein [Myxococcus sp. RHSTA-1-4]